MPSPPQFAGPSAPDDYTPQARQLQGRQDDPASASMLKALAPLLIAQGMDLLSTEKPFGFMAHNGAVWHSPEANPLPGMGSTPGRLGWGLGEGLLAAMLLKNYPSAGKAMVTGGNILHNAMVQRNAGMIPVLDSLNRLPVPSSQGDR